MYPSSKNKVAFHTYNDQDKSKNENINTTKCGIAFLNILDNNKISKSVASDILDFFELTTTSQTTTH